MLLNSLFLACSGGGGDDSTVITSDSSSSTTSTIATSNYAVLGPISNADVKVYRISDNLLAYSGKTVAYTNETQVTWPDNQVGAFLVDVNSSFNDSDLMLVVISAGEDIDPDDDTVVNSAAFISLQGEMKAIAKLSELKANSVRVSALSTMAVLGIDLNQTATQILSALSAYAQNLFVDTGADYLDLNAYVPNLTERSTLINPNILVDLQTSGVNTAILNDSNLTQLLLEDSDGDNLSVEEELFAGSDPSLADTDGDGLDDDIELLNGLDPNNPDTDFDGINDDIELGSSSDPANSDTDEDYLPDGVDANVADPDFNNNGILDGLEDDPFFNLQWYLKSNGDVVSNINAISTIIGNDLGILEVYHSLIGNGSSTIIQVVDSGVEAAHEDLELDLTRSWNAVNANTDPSPTETVIESPLVDNNVLAVGHGTAVAGIIAAKAYNTKGMRGVVPNAVIAGNNWLENQNVIELERAWYNGTGANEILVSNNSWGISFTDDTTFEAILKLSSEQLRDGKGRIFVFAAGNDRYDNGNSNLSYITNNRYALTVAALNYEDKFSSYSSQGSNILVSAYGGEFYQESPTIATTTLMGKAMYENELNGASGPVTVDEDTNKNYTYAMNGTSSAAPMVSGSIALVLEACPKLTWRDVKWLTAHTASKIDESNSLWIKNSAGLSHNINYGFGRINTMEMIKECRANYFELLGNEISSSSGKSDLNILIPDNQSLVSELLNFSSSYTIEWVELTFTSDHTRVGDLEIRLISPSGTSTQLILPNGLSSTQYSSGFRFSSAAFIGENSLGNWRVEVIDRKIGSTGQISALNLKIYGH